MNAGHLPPLLRRASGAFERLEGTNMALGIWDHSTYDVRRTFLDAGDMLVAYSDGITEAEGDDDLPFDEIGLRTIIDGKDGQRPKSSDGRRSLQWNAIRVHGGFVMT